MGELLGVVGSQRFALTASDSLHGLDTIRLSTYRVVWREHQNQQPLQRFFNTGARNASYVRVFYLVRTETVETVDRSA